MSQRRDELVDQLRILGLTKSEARAYLAVVKLRTCRIVEIAREANLQRTELYRIMPRLVSLDLVEENVDRPKRYRATGISSSLPRLARRATEKLRASSKASQKLAEDLRALAQSRGEEITQEVRVIYGGESARSDMMESIRNARKELWVMAGPRRPAHLSDRFWNRALQKIAQKKLRARFIVTVDEENLHRVRRMSSVFDVRHYDNIPVYLYGCDDRSVAVSLSAEPIRDPSQVAQLVLSYPHSVNSMRQLFESRWRESTPLSIREHLILGIRPGGQDTRIILGREEFRALVENYSRDAKRWIGDYLSTRYGPVRLLVGFKEHYAKARERGVQVQLICHLSKENVEAVKELATLFEVRHKEKPIGFDMTVVDESDAIIHHVDPDRPVPAPDRSTYTMHITRKEGVLCLDDLFRQLWDESVPIEKALQKIEEAENA